MQKVILTKVVPYCLFLVLSLQVLYLPAIAQFRLAGLPFVRNFHTGEYKAGIQNKSIAQDKRGLLYIANNFGLLEYDGNEWKTYASGQGTKIRSVAIDTRGRVYVGSQDDFGYFFPNSSGKLTYTSLSDSLPAQYRDVNEIWKVHIDNQKVYFSSFEHVFIYDGSQFVIYDMPETIDEPFSFLINRELYVTDLSSGIRVLEGKNLKAIPGGDYFKNISISTLLPLHSDEFLISTFNQGIFRFGQGTIVPWNASQQSFFKESNINCMIRLRNGNIAVGTQNSGLLILSPEGDRIMQLTNGKGLHNRTVLSLYEDDLSNLWVGQNNCIAYVELGSPFSVLSEQCGLPGTGYAAYLDNDKLYVGTNTGLYVKEKNSLGDFTPVKNISGQLYHIGKYDGDLLAAHHAGTSRIENKEAIKIATERGVWTFVPLKKNPANLIGGSFGGIHLYEKSQGHWKFKEKIKNFDESSRIMEEDQYGNLWMTHGYKGAFKIILNESLNKVDSAILYQSNKGFPSNTLITAFKIRNELLFTAERGVFQYDVLSDSFKHNQLFTQMLGPNAQILAIQEDALGNIYFIGSDHIGVLKKNSIGDYTVETNTFNKIKNYYLNDDLINMSVLKNNEVLFGAKDGFVHYDPAMNVTQHTDFKTLIRNVSITLDNDTDSVIFYGHYVNHDTIVINQLKHYQPNLPYTSNSINFTFTATSYEGDGKLFQYYLENYEKNWSEWNTKTHKEYTNLKEGSYKFHVRAKNVNGKLSHETVYEFYINPPWYRSIWAYSFYGLFVIALLFTGFNLLDRKYQREQKLMTLKQETELNQKENELNKLTQQSQEEISRLQHEKLESELRHMNNELGTSTMHLLNKNEFIMSVKNNLTHIIKKSVNEEVKKELLQITKDIENNISADSDWEQFQYHFDRVHGDFSTRFKAAFPNLSPQEMKLSAYLRMNLSSKEIAQLLNISIRGVEISRYRLRKKLHLDRNKNLQEFILNF
jgi:ligand-binding sensor domain-containing protein/DNA-binding CsgD family transcriptional regulator